jgi:hypothetical protein
MARRVLGRNIGGIRLRGLTPKLIVPLNGKRGRRSITPLKAIYVLSPPSTRKPAGVRIKDLTARQACLELVRNTFNMAIEDSGRLERQFAQATRVALTVPVKSLSYPRRFGMLSEAREAILRDLQF